MIFLKSKEQIDIMDQANRIVHNLLDYAEQTIKPGMTTGELDELLEKRMSVAPETTPAFKGYRGYSHVSCISINEEIVHGVPGKKIIQDGDIVSVDVGVKHRGFFGDAARTFIVGTASLEVKRLVDETKRALYAGIEQMREGNRLYDINKAIEKVAKENSFGIVRGFSGHGVGSLLHEAPHVFNYIENKEPNVRLKSGMTLALEPMFVLGKPDCEILDDGWTVITKDKSIAVHWEVSIAITESGPRVLGI